LASAAPRLLLRRAGTSLRGGETMPDNAEMVVLVFEVEVLEAARAWATAEGTATTEATTLPSSPRTDATFTDEAVPPGPAATTVWQCCAVDDVSLSRSKRNTARALLPVGAVGAIVGGADTTAIVEAVIEEDIITFEE